MAQAEYEIMGFSERIGADNLSRYLPLSDPAKPYLYAERCTFVEGRGADGFDTYSLDGYQVKGARYKKGVFKVDFKWRPYDLIPDDEIGSEYDRFVEIEENGTTDYVTPPAMRSQLKWVGGGTTVNQQVAVGATYGKLIPYSNVTMHWYQVPYAYMPKPAILASYGKVSNSNLGVDSSPNTYFEAATLLFCGARWRRSAMAFGGTPSVDISYFFRHDTGENPDQAAQRGPNTFLCFLEDPIVRRLLSKTGLDPGIGSRDGKCVYDEFDPYDLFRVT